MEESHFTSDEWKKSTPYDLTAVSIHSGFPGKDHLYIHFKAADGHWYKAIGDRLEPVREQPRLFDCLSEIGNTGQSSMEAAISDSTGLHMNAGPFSLVYSRRDVSTALPDILEQDAVVSTALRTTRPI